VSSLAADRRPGFVFEIDVRQLLAGAVLHDEGRIDVLADQGGGKRGRNGGSQVRRLENELKDLANVLR
jgi:hypothetical protein